ncbi:hypothetical protein SAMN04487761_1644 [Lachnospiraceae bacterium C7]|nr:hypothetical protein SAMN04487761_1644 [Lachnospiraceae bacterium C7]
MTKIKSINSNQLYLPQNAEVSLELAGNTAQVVAPFAWAKLSKAGECVKVVKVASEGEKSVALAEEGIGAASKVRGSVYSVIYDKIYEGFNFKSKVNHD